MPRRIIGLCGYAQSGKDTAGLFLGGDHGFVRDAFADDLKKALLMIDPFVPVDHPVRYVRLGTLVTAVGWDDAKANPEVRRLLGATGTEAGWMLHGKRLWIDRVAERARALGADRSLVVTDVRFPEEEEWLRESGGVLIEVRRPGVGPLDGANGDHSSEAISKLHPDAVLLNDGAVSDLRQKVDALVATL